MRKDRKFRYHHLCDTQISNIVPRRRKRYAVISNPRPACKTVVYTAHFMSEPEREHGDVPKKRESLLSKLRIRRP